MDKPLIQLIAPVVKQYLAEIQPSDDELEPALLKNSELLKAFVAAVYKDVLKTQADKASATLDDVENTGYSY